MRRLFILGSLVLPLLAPALSQGATVCMTDNFGNAMVLDVKPACKASSPKPAAIHGRMLIAAGIVCNGSRWVGIVGTCFGAPSEGKVHVNFTDSRAGSEANCTTTFWSAQGTTIATASGSVHNPDSHSEAALTFTPAACSSIPLP